ncbi:tetratricopeptide repeat protein [Panacibacter sp. DH6]|uniref:Tetratricopeptide repeat protein n=1 Tax=Panacibacter microcysteis TaxID=2793269 RepID=A0A931H0F3_9BACT|nr:tetratricopeptide repeat protein [Panacibacter microcysteis]MBG9378734.1 tetratricopeptide repeat protein [Panacibacter microcysteis]
MLQEENHTNNDPVKSYTAQEQDLLASTATGEELYHFYNSWGNELYNIDKDYEAAERRYRQAIQHHPDAFISYSNLGLALQKLGKPGDAVEAFRKSIEIADRLHQKNDAAWEHLCVEMGARGEWKKAEELILGHNVANLHISRFYNAWGNHLHNAGADYAAAEHKYRKAISYNPDSFIDYKNLGLALQMQNKSAEAIAAFRQSIDIAGQQHEKNDYAWEYIAVESGKAGDWENGEKEITSNNVAPQNISRFYNAWGNSLFITKKDYKAAEEKYIKATEFNPDSYVDYRNLGLSLQAQKKYTESIASFRKAGEVYKKVVANGAAKSQHESDYVDALSDWGSSLIPLGELEEAKQKFNECININPGYAGAYENLAFIMHKEKKYDESLAYLNKALQYNPDSTWAYFRKALIHEERKQYNSAIASYERVLEKDPSDAFAQHNIANIYWTLGSYKKGKEKWNDTVRLYKRWMTEKRGIDNDDNFYFYYGWILNEIFGSKEEARSILKIGLAADSKNHKILYALATLYKQVSDEDNAERAQMLWQSREYLVEARNIIQNKLIAAEITDVSLLTDMVQLLLESNDFHFATILLYNRDDIHTPLKKKFSEVLELLEERSPDSALVKALIGIYHSRMEDYKKAAVYFKQSLAYNEDDITIWSNLAETYLNQQLFELAYKEYSKILQKAECHVESLIGLGECCIRSAEKDDPDLYDAALRHFNKALDLSRTGEGSKVLHNKEKSALLYSRGFVTVQIYESRKDSSATLLIKALSDFKESYKLDKDRYKAKIACDKIKQRLSLLSSKRTTEKFGPGLIFFLSLFVFVTIQVLFFKSYFFSQKAIIDFTAYSLFTFGSIVFMIAALYLPNVLKLKVAGIELEKSSIDLIAVSGNLGISRDVVMSANSFS